MAKNKTLNYDCFVCDTDKSVKVSWKDLGDELEVSVFRCSNCKHQHTLKKLMKEQEKRVELRKTNQ